MRLSVESNKKVAEAGMKAAEAAARAAEDAAWEVRMQQQQQSTAVTEAQAASDARDTLRAEGAASVGLPPSSSGPAVLTQAEQGALDALPNEASVLVFMAPYIMGIRGFPRAEDGFQQVLVNSEEQQWLSHKPSGHVKKSKLLKPDWFVSWRPFVKYTDAAMVPIPEGVLASARLQDNDCVQEVYEGKLKSLGDGALGQLVNYHKCIHGDCRGMLLSKEGFTLYHSRRGVPIALIERVSWTALGSRGAIEQFFGRAAEPKLLTALRKLLSWGKATLDCTRGPFLGAGAFGRVFAVKGAMGERLALKVVMLSKSHGESEYKAVADEHAALQRAHGAGAPVIEVEKMLYCDDAEHDDKVPTFCGYYLREVGCPVEVATAAQKESAFTALGALHVRSIVHGDARPANLLSIERPRGSCLAWIDFRTTIAHGAATAALYTKDACTLAAGCGLSAKTAERLQGYGAEVLRVLGSGMRDPARAATLIKFLHEALAANAEGAAGAAAAGGAAGGAGGSAAEDA